MGNDTKSAKELGKKAIESWGFSAQVDMIIEECAELIFALQKGKRCGWGNVQNICEEIGDVQILIEQARLMFDSDLIDQSMVRKLNRLSRRLDRGENEDK